MRKPKLLKQILALALAVTLLAGIALPAAASGETSHSGVSIKQVDNSVISADLGLNKLTPREDPEPEYSDTDTVRVSIVLEEKSTIAAGYSTLGIAQNPAAVNYRAKLEQRQAQVTSAISKQALGGKKLDTVWNLTLAANIISANVPYGRINAIKAVPGVKNVVLEKRYTPDVYSIGGADPNMATSSSMIGSPVAYSDGYTGAGSRIAIIDTGTDTDHQSFDAGAFVYSLRRDAEILKVDPDQYIDSLDLLEADEINSVLTQLNAYEAKHFSADQLYLNSKLAFGYNYVDRSLYITHDEDDQSEHGSHVAGIATANKYIPAGDGTYNVALDTVKVQGVAPDAQLITMKVFGKGGGAYDADYMAAIEDAIVLGCDVINMSLGSDNGGMLSGEYQNIMDMLADPDKNPAAVLSVSAGNSGAWSDNTGLAAALGAVYPYADSMNFQMVGSPSTYTNALSVASVDNVGLTSNLLTFQGTKGEAKEAYSESYEYSNKPILTLDTSKDGKGTAYPYIFIDGIGTEEDFDALGDEVIDKIVLCARGEIAFSEKANNARRAGAIGVIIYNNVASDEPFGMDLSDYKFTAPAINISKEAADRIRKVSKAVELPGSDFPELPFSDTDIPDLPGVEKEYYYTGEIIINKMGAHVEPGDSAFYTMSEFSSWGVPGSLQLKPEITAPGGSIYSVNGLLPGGEAYENMSGTSMAAPQVTGMSAVLAQYIDTLELPEGVTQRQLIQSLLMSTAKPIVEDYDGGTNSAEETSGYYSVLNQGAGLADVGAAVSAHSFIMMDANATSGAADGKVKAELGDNVTTKSFSFTIHDLSGKGGTYALSADLFTQDAFTAEILQDVFCDFLDKWTTPLTGAAVTFAGDQVTGSSVTVPAGGSATVTVTVDVTGCELLDDYPNGAYVEGFIFASEKDGTEHSIPVLGYTGSWTDPSMYEVGNYWTQNYGLEPNLPYIYFVGEDGGLEFNTDTNVLTALSSEAGEYIFGGNPLGLVDNEYFPERAAINSETSSFGDFYFSPIRNAGNSMFLATSAEGEVYFQQELGPVDGAFYYSNGSYAQWMGHTQAYSVGWDLTDGEGNPLPEGTVANVSLVLVPEYYGEYDPEAKTLTYDWEALLGGELGAGAFLSYQFTVDNSKPVISDVKAEGTTLSVTAKDNNYLSSIIVFNEDGSRLVTLDLPNQEEPNTAYTAQLDMSQCYGTKFFVAVYDYAMNCSTYELTVTEPFNGADLTGKLMMLDGGSVWQTLQDGAFTPLVESPKELTAATYLSGYLFATDAKGNFYVADKDNVDALKPVSSLGVYVTDMAADAQNGILYALADGVLYTVDKLTGQLDEVGQVGLEGIDIPQYYVTGTDTLALDDQGNFYSIGNLDGHLYTYTLETLAEPTDLGLVDYLFDAAQTLEWNPVDGKLYWAQYLSGLDADLNFDGKMDAADAQIILDCAAGNLDPSMAEVLPYMGGDVNGDGEVNTYDAYLLLNTIQHPKQATLITLDTATAKGTPVCALDGPVTALVATPESETPDWAASTDAVSGVTVSPAALDILAGDSTQLAAFVAPWTAEDKSVTWTSSNEDIATVNAVGVVTVHQKGEVTITATSVADPTKSGSCVLTCKTVNYTFNGALMDPDSKVQMFTYDLGKDSTYTITNDTALAPSSLSAITKSTRETDTVYLMDGTQLYKLDNKGAAKGEPVNYNKLGAFTDMVYMSFLSKRSGSDLIMGVQPLTIYEPFDPANPDEAKSSMLAAAALQETGASYLVAMASAGHVKFKDDWGDVPMIRDAELCYVLDNLGHIFKLYFYEETPSEDGESEGDFAIQMHGTNFIAVPGLSYFLSQDYECFCSMVVSNDGQHLFLSYYNEARDTSELYMITPQPDGYTYETKRAGSFGDSIWPVALTEAISNDPAPAPGGEDLTGTSVEEYVFRQNADGTVECLQKPEAAVTAAPTAAKAPSAGQMGISGGKDEMGTVSIDLSVDNSTNGLIEITYDPAALTVTSVTGDEELVYFSANSDTAGTVLFAYAQEEAVSGKVGKITFTYNANSVPDTTVITLTAQEDGDTKPGTTQELPIVFREVAKPTKPSTGGSSSTPSGNDKPTGDQPVVETKTDKDGTVTTKTTWADGTVAEKVTTAEGDVTLTVTNSDGETIVDLSVPAQTGETGKDSYFKDVHEGDWFKESVDRAAALGLVNGTSEDLFTPDGLTTSATVVTILHRLAGTLEFGTDANVFDDVDVDAWYADSVNWAASIGLVNGTGNGFEPETDVTRERFMTILYRFAKLVGMDVDVEGDLSAFTDKDQVSDYAADAMSWAVAVGLVNGRGSNQLAAGATATRAEMATLLVRFVDYLTK